MDSINAKDVADYARWHGVTGPKIDGILQAELDKLKNVPLNMAVTGESGSGKSSFINAIRGLVGDDEGAAAVGVTETTVIPTDYTHPENKSLRFWDLPGVGTPKFPRETYLKDVDFSKYDLFIICSQVRFTENDLWLAKEVNSQGKKFLFLRTNIDSAIDGEKRRKNFDESKMMKTIKEYAEENFREAGLDKYHIFLISNHDPHKWDFPSLVKHLIDELPDLKRQAFILSLNILTDDIIEEKKKMFLRLIPSTYLDKSNPMPRTQHDSEKALYDLTSFFMRQLGLDEASLEAVSESTGMSSDNLQDASGATAMPTDTWRKRWVKDLLMSAARRDNKQLRASSLGRESESVRGARRFRMAVNNALDELGVAAHKVLNRRLEENEEGD